MVIRLNGIWYSIRLNLVIIIQSISTSVTLCLTKSSLNNCHFIIHFNGAKLIFQTKYYCHEFNVHWMFYFYDLMTYYIKLKAFQNYAKHCDNKNKVILALIFCSWNNLISCQPGSFWNNFNLAHFKGKCLMNRTIVHKT